MYIGRTTSQLKVKKNTKITSSIPDAMTIARCQYTCAGYAVHSRLLLIQAANCSTLTPFRVCDKGRCFICGAIHASICCIISKTFTDFQSMYNLNN